MDATCTVMDRLGNKINSGETPGVYSAREIVLGFTTNSDGTPASIPLTDSSGLPLVFNAFLLGSQFVLGTSPGFNAKLQIGIGAEDVFAGLGQGISGISNQHPAALLVNGSNSGVTYPSIIGQPTLVIDSGGNAKTGKIQLTLKLIG